MNTENRYCVYVHKDKEGNIRYIGSGNKNRPYLKSNRNKEHSDIFYELFVEIAQENMTKEDAIDLEIVLYDKYVGTGLLLNKVRPCKVKTIDYESISKYLKYDETSPSSLRWNEEIVDDYSKRLKRGKVAGTVKKSPGYYVVKILGIKYFAHRLVYVLCSQLDIPSNMVIDHIDRNKLNNKFTNLRATTQQINVLNVGIKNTSISSGYITKRNSRNISGVIGVYWDISKKVWIVTYTNPIGESKQKTFNPRKLYSNENEEVAKSKTFGLACSFRKEFERSIEQRNL